jgi:hypothetical protein
MPLAMGENLHTEYEFATVNEARLKAAKRGEGMYYKPDWDQAKERMLAWWDHEIIDRACVAVHAPKRGSDMPPFPNLTNGPWLGGLEDVDVNDTETIKHWWVDPDLNRQRAITWFENNWFGGEALPVTYVNWGAMALAGMYGSELGFHKTSIWYSEVIKDWSTWKWAENPRDSYTWRQIQDIMDALAEGAEGRYFVGKPELGNGADAISMMRGMEKLAFDLYTEPEAVDRGVEIVSDAWVSLMEEMYQRTTAINDGGDVLAWMGIWAPGRVDQIACDFSSIISPDMFRRFFIGEVQKMGQWCDNGVYHLDGPDCMRNDLDILLEQDDIQVIQFTPGVGFPPTSTPEYLPRLKRILESGRGLYLLAEPDEVQTLLEYLGPKGVFMRVYLETQDEAEQMLKDVTKWSASGNVFGGVDTPG